ncbi:MAG: dehydrogenase, partial [Saprospiraceae bacterium]|nr:dehydrogenase [Saprospiraceae bacterium]
MKKFVFLTCPLILVILACTNQKDLDDPARTFEDISEEEKHLPENALLSFENSTDVELTLFASEPMISNPTNMDIDARGRVWMCEVQNYRLPYNPTFEARANGDRILILEDTDGDGVADQKKVFYEGNDINGALGIAVLGTKVIVSASPNVLIFYDENQDDIPEKKDTLFSLIKGVDDDHGTHAFVFGPDGRLYFNFGNAGKQIRDKRGQPIIDKFGRAVEAHGKPYRQGMAFRCNIDGSDLEVLGYNFRNIYELCVDSYGNIFQSDNDDDGNKGVRINHIVEYGNYGYQDQITGAGWRERRVGMHDEIPMRHWHVNDPGVIPNMLMTGAGSPAGITFYEGSTLPPAFHNQVIHAEPGHQVVRAYLIEKDKAGYKASIKNLVRSKDKWFRPSDVCVAPDGSLFIADWHDAVVGGNGMDDRNRGRIYRVTTRGSTSSYEIPPFNLDSPEQAITALLSPNQATRYLAHMTLMQSGMAAEPALLSLFERNNPIATARSSWLLARLPQKGLSYVKAICTDGNEDLRIAGIRMMRYLYPNQVLGQVQSMTNDPSLLVRKEIAIALTGYCDDQAIDIWLDLVDQFDPEDRWSLEALGLSTDHCPDRYFNAWIDRNKEQWNTPKGHSLIWRIRSAQALPYLSSIIKDPSTPRGTIARYFRSFHFIESNKKDNVLGEILQHYPSDSAILKYVLLSINPSFLKKTRSILNLVLNDLDDIKGSPEWFTTLKNLRLKTENESLWSMVIDDEQTTEIKKDAAATLINIAGLSFVKARFRELST